MPTDITAMQNLATTATAFLLQYGFQIVGAIIILLIGFKLAGWVAGLVGKLCERRKFDVTLSRFFANITRVAILTFVCIIALGKFGITIAPFIAALGAIAFGTSLALQGPLSNYGAGIAIILGRPFVVGNTIMVQGVSGVVEEVALAATILNTEDGEQITIPNRKIVGEILHNSFANKIVETSIGISYDDDPERAISVIREVLVDHQDVVQAPPPQIGIASFADSGIEIAMRYWAPSVMHNQVRFAVNAAVYRAITEAKITIPYPRREVQMLT